MAVVKRVGPVSLAKMLGGVYALMGLIGVAFFLPFMLLIPLLEPGASQAWLGLGAGLVMLVAAPVVYGILGLVGGALVAVVYNWLARPLGGIELQIE